MPELSMNKTKLGMPAFKNADGFLISLLGFVMILIYSHHGGIGISPDSIAYVSVARNINTDGLLIDYNLKPLVDFPVFYPFFLSIAGFLTRADQVAIAPYLNGLLFAGVIMITGHLTSSFKEGTNGYKRIILILIALSPSLHEIYSMLWSETLFIFLTIVFIAAFGTYLRKRSVFSLIICAAVAAIACITRYAGVTIIATGLMLLVFDRSLAWRQKLTHLVLFGCTAASLLVINLLHNTSITGSLTGARQAGVLSLSDNIVFFGRVICYWLPVWGEQARLVSGVAIFIFIVITGLFLMRAWLNKSYTGTENCFAAFFIVYTVFIIGISTLSHFEEINNRLLSPLFIPLLIALTSWIPGILKRPVMAKYRMVLVPVLLLIVAILTGYQLRQDLETYREAKDSGIPGYNDDSWKGSETAKFLRMHPDYFNPAYELYSNAHEAAYFNGGIRSDALPQRVDKGDIRDFFKKDGLYLIWFDNFSDDEFIRFRTIWNRSEVVKLRDFKDGDIFFIRPRHFSPRPQ